MQSILRTGRKQKDGKNDDRKDGIFMAQINNKAVRSLSKLMEAGFDNEKVIMAMTMDDILSLPNISVAEIGMINKIQKAVKANKVITFLSGGTEAAVSTTDKE